MFQDTIPRIHDDLFHVCCQFDLVHVWEGSFSPWLLPASMPFCEALGDLFFSGEHGRWRRAGGQAVRVLMAERCSACYCDCRLKQLRTRVCCFGMSQVWALYITWLSPRSCMKTLEPGVAGNVICRASEQSGLHETNDRELSLVCEV